VITTGRTQPESAAVNPGVPLLEEMLAIPSPSRQEADLARWLASRLESLGFSVQLDEVGNLIAGWGSGAKEIMLLGHIDTVPGIIPVRREGDRLFGRGAVDAKGPLAAAITAVAAQPVDGPCRFTVIGAVEEEGSSRGARHLASRPAPEQLIVLEPSGWDSITLGYKGSLHLNYRLSVPVAHGAGPNQSAADRAIAFVRHLQDFAAEYSQGQGTFTRLDVRVIRFDAGHDGLRDTAAMLLAFRLPPGFDVDALEERLGTWRDGADIEIAHSDQAIRAEKNTPVVRAFLKAIREAGGTPTFKMKTGTSDMNIVVPVWGCASLAYGPGDSRLDHTPEEAIDLQEFDRGVEVLSSALKQLAK
jgi:LysW-gamma-L-lysine carboxypeptidase